MENVDKTQELLVDDMPIYFLIASSPTTFTNVVQRLRDTGSVKLQQGCGGGNQRNVDAEEEILNMVEDDPSVSTRQIALTVNLARSTVWQTLRENQLHPFHLQRVHNLSEDDYPHRVRFCQWLVDQNADNPNFLGKILFTDEANFSRQGILNIHNRHVWAIENPHTIYRTDHQRRFSINLWCGLINNFVIGPFLLPARLNGESYLNFLVNELQPLLEDVPLDIRQQMYFMHDGAPPHFRRDVRHYIDNTFGDFWIGRGGPVAWPHRSLDLNPLDFFFWGHLRDLVYKREVNTIDDLRNNIYESIARIREQDVFPLVRDSLLRRAHLCIRVGGSNFEL